MAKKRRTELDIDRDFLSQEQEAPPPPPKASEPPPPPPPPASKRRKVNKVKLAIVTGVSLATVSLTGAIVWLAVSFIQSMPESHEEAKPKAAQEASPKPKTSSVAPMYSLHPFFIPIKEKGVAGGKFARIQFALEMTSTDVQKDVDRNITLVRENVYFMLQGKDKSEFTGREKLEKLAVDVAIAVNRSLQSGGVTRVWITDILIS